MENTQIGTTVEQSEKLIEAGLNPNTADLHYNNASYKGPNYNDELILSNFPYTKAIELYRNTGFTESLFFKCIPSWSIGALWHILYSNKVVLSLNPMTISPEQLIELLVDHIVYSIEGGYLSPILLASK